MSDDAAAPSVMIPKPSVSSVIHTVVPSLFAITHSEAELDVAVNAKPSVKVGPSSARYASTRLHKRLPDTSICAAIDCQSPGANSISGVRSSPRPAAQSAARVPDFPAQPSMPVPQATTKPPGTATVPQHSLKISSCVPPAVISVVVAPAPSIALTITSLPE